MKKDQSGRIDTERILYICLLAVLGFCVLTFYYTDFMDTLDNSVLLVESITKGQFRQFYQYAADNAHFDTVYSANYNILMYLIFAIWNFPTVLLHLVTGADYMNNLFAVLWCKGLICISIAACAEAVRKITRDFSEDKRDAHRAAILFLASMATILSAFIAVQYDSIMLALVLWGIYFYSHGNRKRALILFSFAVPLKLFALFVVIPVILTHEKKIFRAVASILVTMVPQVVVGLPFLGDKTWEMVMHSQNNDAIGLLLDGASVGSVNLFFLLLVVVCIFCFMVGRGDTELDDNEIEYLSTYASFVVFAGFCILVPVRSYWLILFAPFMAMLVYMRKDHRFICLLLELGAGLAGGVYFLIHHHIYRMPEICQKLLFRIISIPEGRELRYGSLSGFLQSADLLKFKPVFLALMAACVLCLAVIRAPGFVRKERLQKADERGYDVYHIAFRIGACVCVLAVFLYAKLATQPVICAGVNFNKPVVQEFSLDQEEKEDDTLRIPTDGICQEVIFSEGRELSAFEIMLRQVGYERYVRYFITFALYDSDGTCIWQDKVGMTEIGNTNEGKVLRLKMKDVYVEADKPYTLTISRSPVKNKMWMQAYVCLDPSGNVKYSFR